MSPLLKFLLGIIVGIFSTLWYLRSSDDYKSLMDANKVHEERINSMNNLLAIEKLKTNGFKKDIDSLDARLMTQKNDTIIKWKYGKIKEGVVALNSTASVELLTTNLSKVK